MPPKSNHPIPKIGKKYQHRFSGQLYTMTVVQTETGVGYKVGDKVYQSPTAAAKSLVGKNQFTNGRKFWHMDNDDEAESDCQQDGMDGT